jgi:hypothetical protein
MPTVIRAMFSVVVVGSMMLLLGLVWRALGVVWRPLLGLAREVWERVPSNLVIAVVVWAVGTAVFCVLLWTEVVGVGR